MSDFGTVLIDRGVFEHPVFPDEPFSAREAWLWLVCAAVKRPRRRRVGHAAINLARGQLAYSHRFMAKRWSWSVSKVQRYLSRLVTESMIESVTESGVTRVTICNYDKFQGVPELPESVNESPPNQIREKPLLSIDSELVGGAESRARAREETFEISEQATQLADEIMLTFGIDIKFIPPGWCGAPMWLQAGLNSGWRPELVRITAAKLKARKNFQVPYSFRYLGQPIQREHELFAEPHLPITPVIAAKNNEVDNVQKTSVAADWKQSRDGFRAARAKFKAGLDADAAAGSGDSRSIIRFAAPAGYRKP